MGQANTKQRAEVEMIVSEVRDIQSSIRRHSQDLDDVGKDNLHKRLIGYLESLQNINRSLKNKNSKEIKEAIKLVSKVTEELLEENSLDLGSIETNSFIHIPSKEIKNGSIENLTKDNMKKQTKARKELLTHDQYRIPTLEEIKDKTYSLKREVETSIRNEDVNQMLVQQKIIQILATDLELLSYEPHSPLQERKNSLEKNLSSLYRKLEKSKQKIRKEYKNITRQQNAVAEGVTQLENISKKIDEVMSRALLSVKNKDMKSLLEAKDEIISLKPELEKSKNNNEEVTKVKVEVEEKIKKLLDSLEKETLLLKIDHINQEVDKAMTKARILIKERKFADLGSLRDAISNYESDLAKIDGTSEEVTKFKAEVQQKLSGLFNYLDKETKSQGEGKSQKVTRDLKKVRKLVAECQKDINDFDQNTEESEFKTYEKHLDDLEAFLQKAEYLDEVTKQLKESCQGDVNNARMLLRTKTEKVPTDKQISVKSVEKENGASGEQNASHQDNSTDENIVLRKNPSHNRFGEKNIDSFYSFWKDLETNLPANNCTYEELKQIALLLHDIEVQIHNKRIKIENFFQLKESGIPILGTEISNNGSLRRNKLEENRKIIDEVDNPVKTSAKIYNLSQPKNLIIDDKKILQNIEEINTQIKHIDKQSPEKVVISTDSTSESSAEVDTRMKIPEETVETLPPKSQKASDENIQETKPDHGKIQEQVPQETAGVEQDGKYRHIENITQVQNICRDVEYLKEKALTFSGSKQTPKYVDIKGRLESYRKTLNILTSYQNESITMSCNRVLENIGEIEEILSSNTEKEITQIAKNTTKRITIETMFTDIMNIKTLVDDLSKKIDQFGDAEINAEYNNIKSSLLKNKEKLNHMQVTANYEVIASSKADVIRQIDECVYSLDFKLEENKMKNEYILHSRDSNTEKVVKEFEKIKDKINRFSGSYKNVLYREIEKGAEKCLKDATDSTTDKAFIANLNEDVANYLKILEEKSIKEESYTDSLKLKRTERDLQGETKKNAYDSVAIRLSRIRQNLKDIREQLYSPRKQTLKLSQELEHRINLNILELSSLTIETNEPFYFDKESLKYEFRKLESITKDNISAIQKDASSAKEESKDQATRLVKSNSGIAKQELSRIEQSLASVKGDIDQFADGRSSDKFFALDELLTRLSMDTDKIFTKRGSDLHARKRTVSKVLYQYCELLENKAQSYEILHNVDKKMEEVTYRLHNFENLSAGDYSALYKELTDLEITLRDLNVSDNMSNIKIECQSNIQQCMRIIEDRMNNREECGSDDGTFV